jgi:uncharacterized membrane protein YeaQ/YmgE (transglycosylase-associated protein family)
LRAEFAFIGVILVALAGFLIGTLLEHPPGPGGLQFIGAVIGAILALAALAIGEAVKPAAG